MPSLDMELAAGGRVAGVDEAGRGPLAGPVVAAAVVLRADTPGRTGRHAGRFQETDRQSSVWPRSSPCGPRRAEIGIGAASVAEILRLNILHASMLAMRRAVARLRDGTRSGAGGRQLSAETGCAVRCVVGGDALCLSIAAASIVAKVVRDRAMARLASGFPATGGTRTPATRPRGIARRCGAWGRRATIGRHSGLRWRNCVSGADDCGLTLTSEGRSR